MRTRTILFQLSLLLLTCRPLWGELALQHVALGFSSAVFACAPPADGTRLFVVEQGGRIRIIDLASGTIQALPFLDIDAIVGSGGERGLLGLAFDPGYATNGYFYVNYTDNTGDTVVARYSVSANPDIADPASALELRSWNQPYSNHNGGWIGFGPDSMLYISLGDGGSGNDPGNRAQNLLNPLGKLMRLDPGLPGNDFVPLDNPFSPPEGLADIWAYGLRNAWRCSFDRLTGDLWMADVGQNAWEEIDLEPAGSPGGGNYGWACREGLVCTGLHDCGSCSGFSSIEPVHVYNHAGGHCSVTGGYVYRGSAVPELAGLYLFADYCSHDVWSLEWDRNSATVSDHSADLDPGSAITSFAEDAAGELYIVTFSTIYRIISNACGNGLDCNDNGTDDDCDIELGTSEDCNGNGVPDECDIESGTSQDADGDGIPDECVLVGSNNCDDADWITDGSWSFDTSSATTDGSAHASCQFDGQTYNDLWVKYLAPCTGTLSISLCGSGYDTDLVCYEGADCPFDDGDLLGCNDDGCPGSSPESWRSQLEVPIAQGYTYMIRIGGYGPSSAGEGTITLSCSGTVGCGNGADCNSNGSWDDCDIEAGDSQDCNDNGIPDECDIAQGTSADQDENGVPDECQQAGGWQSEHFRSATACAQCHNQGDGIYDDLGEDHSPYTRWEAGMMANSARDPYWLAKVIVEMEQFSDPAVRDAIQTTCVACHAPMGKLEQELAGESDYDLADLAGDPVGKEGVSCTLCHQLQSSDPEDPASWSGGFSVNTDHEIYGPFPPESASTMVAVTGFPPVESSHLGENATCVSCHTLFTPTLNAAGVQIGTFPEQVPYLEMLNSSHAASTCISCHLPLLEGAKPISGNPTGLSARSPRRDHAIMGGNSLMLKLMAQNTEELNTLADSQAFTAMAERTDAFLETAATLESSLAEVDGQLQLDLLVRNRTGHKLPTGIPVRRLWLEVEARDEADSLLFHSGAWDGQGRIVGQDTALEVHHDLITSQEQVQIWESRMLDDQGEGTWTLMRANGWQKENRIPPEGFDAAAGPHIVHTAPVGACLTDSNFNEAGSGADQVSYLLPAASRSIQVRLNFQAVTPQVVDAMRSSQHTDVLSFLQMWDAADLSPVAIQELALNHQPLPQLGIVRLGGTIRLEWGGGGSFELFRRIDGGNWQAQGVQASPWLDSGIVQGDRLVEYQLRQPVR